MLTLIPTPIGNIGDISLRAIEALSEADTLLCEDTRVTKKLIHILKERYNTSFKPNQNFISLHSHNEKEFIEKLEPSFFEQNVIYVSDAGMPGISDPGQALVKYCQENGIKYDIFPGANALLTAFVASGFVETKMLFWGFLPHKGKDRAASLQGALSSGHTTILYESPHRLEKLLNELSCEEPLRKIFLAKELTKKYQKYYFGTADEVKVKLDANLRGEWVVVIEAGSIQNSSAITQNDILELDLPKKVQAKLIGKITGENTKACYERLLNL
ncbi:MAG: 16S rRNA (cytidine(1402)-2'-O)-methyltransferase [Sulfurimonas sp. RIFOXYD12_FULL_33_39]|uniref:16S rRNA (cytidine(1402)-2'-O)-methyltransferase n=1 Tax=unclassified Sulfurimonas TaxID=2623549 RepID=UPI0008B8212C|nr:MULTISPECIES: 16S rRNA (cytidine(1402)-2'-O)-methyltransferase [unclassified Sulfurimonas]OHE06717.1 MAG: 16S rRNA (cytidine(1402)-2'-O)-methyltransferase [Sulfurimonas sp. RIFCSPLOWO2_12_FULL_34_6]OHE09788.1 MAG: 16S rRNA (cytidine(1402)-2'-O)-methyltransferase [Sulfurimonas sp. RIFOXYD12_FULL_33_39]OHE13704.1 MAG: 16S rRNA (cytidine(1402)-2'-O)-methyltransferase [Sulfurimonas sp. RIFOXYD2_FULL_34_21]DAB28081.1 MAG TPA: 16S rRNA (cytidine(1402)-2'-O)-methyltransferase [Sulfurimonas sp. UBA1